MTSRAPGDPEAGADDAVRDEDDEPDETDPGLPAVEANLLAHARGGVDDPIGLGRLLALSDGVFSIAMTLLVFTLRLPTPGDSAAPVPEGTVERLLRDLEPRIVSFVISFALLGLFWMQHHRRFRWIQRYDDVLLWLNLLFLFWIVVIPFATELIGQFDGDRVAAMVYSGSLAAAGFSSALLWWYATRKRRLVDPDLPDRIVEFGTLYGLLAAVVFLFAGIVALVNTRAAQLIWFIPIPASLVLEFYRHRSLKSLLADERARQEVRRKAEGRG